MKKIKILLSIVMTFTLFGCQNKASKDSYTNANGCLVEAKDMSYYEKYSDTYPSMEYFDTSLSLAVYTNKQSNFIDAFSLMVDKFKYYHQLFDKYNNYDGVNNIKTINDNAGNKPVVVDDDLMELMLLSKEWFELSHGAFDITLGPVLKIWHDYREEGMELNIKGQDGKLPTQEELDAANNYVGWQYVEIDENAKTIYLNTPNASLDVGGVAKGFAVEKVAQTLECSGVFSGFVNAGGNVRMIGSKPDGSAWFTGINHPTKDYSNKYFGSSIISLKMKGQESAVTSGDYQRYYTVSGVEYSHLVSPFTLYPPKLYNSITVKYFDSGVADILSTTLYMLPYAEGLEILNAFGANAVYLSSDKEALVGANVELKDEYFIGSNGNINVNSHFVTWD